MRTSTFFCLFFCLWQLIEAQLTPWDNIIFFFGWSPYEPTIPRCSILDVGWDGKEGAVPTMQGPFSLTALTGGYQPFQFASVNDTGYNWTVQLPAGGPYMMTMKDANGYTGGTSLVFQVPDSPPGTRCDTDTLTPNNLTIAITSSFAECSGMIVTAQGGTAPYTMQIIVSQRPPKTSTWTTSTMSYTIDLQPSEQFFVFVRDANGRTALNGIYTVGTGDSACYEVATTVTSGALPTTLSYDPTSTVSIPTRTISIGTGPAGVLENTATTSLPTIVTFRDGSSSTYTLAPNAAITVEDRTSSNSEKKVNLPAIIGGALGGVAFLALIAFIFFLLKRRDRKRRQKSSPDMMGETRSGSAPPRLTTPGRDHAPLMAHVDSTYSGATSTSPGITHDTTHAPWTIPDPTPHAYANPLNTHHPSSSGSRPSLTISMNRSDTGLPPGAMAPVRVGSILSSSSHMKSPASSSSQGVKSPAKLSVMNATEEGQQEKSNFNPSPGVVAPPPYSAAQAYRQ
ncbi:hypothetical protein CPB86DRAFT_62041 [Serendipita vermifera]|nr:hypothetical protein CPB86DRAFT_62041 [Serendipita vermifera]